MLNFINLIMPYAISFAAPLLIASLGGLVSERSGIVNIALEGLMVIGSFVSAIFVYYLYPSMGQTALWLSMPIAMLAGIIFSLLHAFASVNLNANQVISGTAINMLAPALTVFLARAWQGSGKVQLMLTFSRWDIPYLSKIPILGKLFFSGIYPPTFIVIVLLILTWLFLYKTRWGMNLRACGENPQAADAAGINVYRVRYLAVMMSGAFAALGGAILTLTIYGEFSGSVYGLGFLALACLIFGQWRPFSVAISTLFFGFASTLATMSQVSVELQKIPPVILKILPYVATLIVLIIFSKKSQAPKASGQPFEKGQR